MQNYHCKEDNHHILLPVESLISHSMDTDIIIGSDHAGFELKSQIINHFAGKEYKFTDIGCFNNNSVDYPDIANKLTTRIVNNDFQKGILICGTGIGMSIAANRYNNIRAALCHNSTTAKLSREHNNSNILVLGSRITGFEVSIDIINTWLDTRFAHGRHERRLNLIDNIK